MPPGNLGGMENAANMFDDCNSPNNEDFYHQPLGTTGGLGVMSDNVNC